MIEIIIEDNGWEQALPDVVDVAERAFKAACAFEPALGAVALLLADDARLAELNGRFRGKNSPTNVLSFPGGDDEFSGDVALARETCEREAAAAKVSLRDHAAHLIVHGVLHLIGYDHIKDDEAARMERREAEILATMGVADPYADELDSA